MRFHSLLSDYFLLLLASALQYRAVRCVCSFTYLERRWSNAEKKKNTLDSSDGEELSSRNFSLRNETEFLKIINNRPGGRGRIFNFNTSFFLSSPREEEAAAFLSPRHVADRLEIRRYKDTRRRFDDRKKPYTTKEKEREREVDLKDRCLRYRRGTKKPCGHENRLKHREAYREASHNLARQKDRAFVLPREKGAERGKNEMEEKRGEKEARVVWMRGWDKTGGEERLSPWVVPTLGSGSTHKTWKHVISPRRGQSMVCRSSSPFSLPFLSSSDASPPLPLSRFDSIHCFRRYFE